MPFSSTADATVARTHVGVIGQFQRPARRIQLPPIPRSRVLGQPQDNLVPDLDLNPLVERSDLDLGHGSEASPVSCGGPSDRAGLEKELREEVDEYTYGGADKGAVHPDKLQIPTDLQLNAS
jgi:hypothetical protein